MMEYVVIVSLVVAVVVLVIIITKHRRFEGIDAIKAQNNLLMQLLDTRLNGQSQLLKQANSIQNQTIKEQIERIDKNMLQTNQQIEAVIKLMFKDLDEKQTIQAKDQRVKNVEIEKQLVKISGIDQSLNSLQERIVDLSMILGNTKARGTFGEIQLYQLIDNQFGLQNPSVAKQDKLSTGVVVDLAIMSNSLGQKVCIDSKFPLENYLQYLETAEVGFKNLFVRDIKKHIDDISSKYIIGGETVNFAIMFIPSEAIYLEVMETSTLVEYSYKRKVWLASPTTLIALITMLENINTDYKRAQNISLIESELDKLSLEFERFNKRYNNLSRHMNQIIGDFEEITITQRKLVTRFEAIKKMEMKGFDND
ncbi:DNA recombination protein RmuC [Mollicutes bacterium LVI A0039]|nr:DNA recombination protein RmuC [Mollicutes bacterium LVI A0039]